MNPQTTAADPQTTLSELTAIPPSWLDRPGYLWSLLVISGLWCITAVVVQVASFSGSNPSVAVSDLCLDVGIIMAFLPLLILLKKPHIARIILLNSGTGWPRMWIMVTFVAIIGYTASMVVIRIATGGHLPIESNGDPSTMVEGIRHSISVAEYNHQMRWVVRADAAEVMLFHGMSISVCWAYLHRRHPAASVG